MSSTNKTSHYNLPQFIGSDIPTWLGDFNSAMTAIDSGINAAATSASGAATTAAQASTDAAAAQKTAAQAVTDAAAAQKTANDALQAANRCPFPIGYGGFFQTNPNTIYSGTTWEQKKDVFILAAGDTYGAGSTGGEAQHTLTTAEMPAHDHPQHGLDSYMVTSINISSSQASGRSIDNYSQYTTGNVVHTASEGGGLPHNNMPPYYSMPFWVRTA